MAALARGDSGYGNERILLELEARQKPYLQGLRQAANVQRLVRRQFERQNSSRADNQGGVIKAGRGWHQAEA